MKLYNAKRKESERNKTDASTSNFSFGRFTDTYSYVLCKSLGTPVVPGRKCTPPEFAQSEKSTVAARSDAVLQYFRLTRPPPNHRTTREGWVQDNSDREKENCRKGRAAFAGRCQTFDVTRSEADLRRLETRCLPKKISSVLKYCGSRRTCRRRGWNGIKPERYVSAHHSLYFDHKFVATSCCKKLSPSSTIPTRSCAPSRRTSIRLWRLHSPSTYRRYFRPCSLPSPPPLTYPH